jgi:hypothetical protein
MATKLTYALSTISKIMCSSVLCEVKSASVRVAGVAQNLTSHNQSVAKKGRHFILRLETRDFRSGRPEFVEVALIICLSLLCGQG